jgi:hypothetical protein
VDRSFLARNTSTIRVFCAPRTLPFFSKSLTPSNLLYLQSSHPSDPSLLSYISPTRFAFPPRHLHERQSSQHASLIPSPRFAADLHHRFLCARQFPTHLERYVVSFLLLAMMTANLIVRCSLEIRTRLVEVHHATIPRSTDHGRTCATQGSTIPFPGSTR